MLLHQPYGDTYGAWRALEEAQKAGKIKSIGVSTFIADQMKNLELMSNVKPAVNQIEVSPWFQEKDTVKFNQDGEIAVEKLNMISSLMKRLLKLVKNMARLRIISFS